MFLIPFSTYGKDTSSPEDIALRVYGWVFEKGQNPTPQDLEEMRPYFDDNFYENLIQKMALKGVGELLSGQFEYMPFIFAQDTFNGFQAINIEIDAAAHLAHAHVILLSSNTKASSKITIDFIYQDQQWKISDISSADHSLKKESEAVKKCL